jgi:hypothetical protein
MAYLVGPAKQLCGLRAVEADGRKNQDRGKEEQNQLEEFAPPKWPTGGRIPIDPHFLVLPLSQHGAARPHVISWNGWPWRSTRLDSEEFIKEVVEGITNVSIMSSDPGTNPGRKRHSLWEYGVATR